mgnify:FL=1|uniref:Uncharacterized protein n=1 Tax=virus sp. ctd0M1 TaxID=2827993 RepID=A0A8S5RDL3_9VIRU|nr:MAG TPA: hypothetical protein [virus sp. ctd0M1]
MEKVTVTFEQNNKKAIAKMTIDGNKVTCNLDFVPPLDTKDLHKPAATCVKLAFEFIKFLKGGKQ